ncbi:MAG: PEP-CTERM sorting domain-containing protein [Rubrivivax sp.]|nr:PEP-CTERM sorting domain-containing protein [Rubrivivax sp.]
MTSKLIQAGGVLCALAIASAAHAGVIVGASSATASSSFPDPVFGTVANLINQGGLATGYISGVTDFATYLAGNPQHTIQSPGAEWFTPFGATSATLTFNLGSVLTIASVAAWVDEFWGAGNIDVLTSTDGVSFASVGSFVPTDWATAVSSYSADVFSFAATAAQFVRLNLSNCPQPLSQAGGGCGMGEVAFEAVTGRVPEPASLALAGLALAGLAVSRRRKAV